MKANASVLPPLATTRAAVSRAISPIDHEARIAAAYRLLDYPIALITTQSDATTFAAWRNTALTTGFVALLLIAAVFVGATLCWQIVEAARTTHAARNAVIEADKSRLLAEAELNRQRDISEQSERFNAAVENMSQGLCMFDSANRLVVCNRLYAQMYMLPEQIASTGNAARSNHCLLRAHGHSRRRMR